MRHVSWKGLPRVMVMTLALDKRDQEWLCEQIVATAHDVAPFDTGHAESAWAVATLKVKDGHEFSAPSLARIFAAILELEQPERAEFAAFYDHLLDGQGDLFGTEGQNDPRGDRRDYE